MKLGFGLYRHMLHRDYYQFAKQCGATHVVVHLVDYFGENARQTQSDNQPVGGLGGWSFTNGDKKIWSLESLLAIKKELNDAGLEWEAIENFDPAHWYDILLDGPKKYEQVAFIKEVIRNVGKAGIKVFGYNFSIAGVAGRIEGPFARGNAVSVGMDGKDVDAPIPNGMVWNMQYDPDPAPGYIGNFSHEILWERLAWFLQAIIPVATAAGVIMAAHPDDPPMAYVRNTPRLVYEPHLYQRLLDIYPGKNNALEYCLGSIAEMPTGDIYTATEKYAAQDNIGYIHFRNVVGKAPYYKEVFIDEGDVDMIKILQILRKHNYQGVLIPDHTPRMSCDAPWHAGMAYAMGYMKAALCMLA
jgi:mannonate dehydratase